MNTKILLLLWRLVEYIEFDISVIAEKKDAKKAGIGIFVASLGLGANIENDNKNIAQQRIKFKIPICYPSS